MPDEMPELPGAGPDQDLRIISSVLLGSAVLTGLYVARDVVIPTILAILLSFILAPLVSLLRSVRFGRIGAVIVAVGLALGIMLGVGEVMSLQLSDMAHEVPRYVPAIKAKIGSLQHGILEQFTGVTRAISGPASLPYVTDSASPPDASPTLPKPIDMARAAFFPVIGPLVETGIVVIVAIFILLQKNDLRDRLIRLLGAHDLQRTTRAMDETASRLSRYLLTQLALNALFGIIVGTGLWALGVPNPILWGGLGMLLRFVPYAGTPISAVFPALLAAGLDPGWSLTLYTLALFATTEVVMGQFVDPIAFGRTTGLSPLAVVIATLFWSWMWGLLGLILAVPLTACLVVLGRHVPRLEFLDVLMGNRPALTPAESFYQRILANDPDETLEYAENILRDCSLSTYYDMVAIPGLRHAAHDIRRGVISSALIARVIAAMTHVIDELDEFDDVAPDSAKPRPVETAGAETAPADRTRVKVETPPTERPNEPIPPEWSGPAPILCIAGNGPLDILVADMLGRLLIKNGLGARVVPFESVARAQFAELDLNGARMICLCCLELNVRPSRLVYLTRRLRALTPSLPILAGLWDNEEDSIAGKARASISADFVAKSLREAVDLTTGTARTIATVSNAV